MDRIRIGYPAGYLGFLDQDWSWIFIFEKNWIRTGSGYLFDFYNEIFQRVLSSRCILNMKRLVILKYKQRKTSKASSENNLEVCR